MAAPSTLNPLGRTNGRPPAHGSSGTKRFGGRILEEPLGNLYGPGGIDTYDRMRRSDATVHALFRGTVQPIVSGEWKVELNPGKRQDRQGQKAAPPALATEVLQYVEDLLFDKPDRPFASMLTECFLFLPFGFNVLYKELYPDAKDRKIYLKNLLLRHPRSITASSQPWVFDGDTLVGLNQSDVYAAGFMANNTGVFIPREEFCLFVNQQEGSNVEGISAFRTLYRPYTAKQELLNILLLGLERMAVGTIVVKGPPGGGPEGRDEALLNAARAVRAGSEAALYLNNEEDFSITPGALDAEKLLAAIAYCDREMAKAWLAMWMELGGEGGGTYSLSVDQTDQFMLSLESIAEYVAGVLTRDLIKPLVKLNFGDAAIDYIPTLKVVLRKETKAQIADMLTKVLAIPGAFTISEQDEDLWRQWLDFGERTLPRETPEDAHKRELEKITATAAAKQAGTQGNGRPPTQPKPGATGPARPDGTRIDRNPKRTADEGLDDEPWDLTDPYPREQWPDWQMAQCSPDPEWELFNPYHAKDGKFTGRGGAHIIARGGGAPHEKGEAHPDHPENVRKRAEADAKAKADAEATKKEAEKSRRPKTAKEAIAHIERIHAEVEAEVAGHQKEIDRLHAELKSLPGPPTSARNAPYFEKMGALRNKMMDLNAGRRERILKAISPEKGISIAPEFRAPTAQSNPGEKQVTGPVMKKNAESGFAAFGSMIAPRPDLEKRGREKCGVREVPKRAYFQGRNEAQPYIAIDKSSGDAVVIHELGHWLEHTDGKTSKAAKAFLANRTRGESLVRLNAVTGNRFYHDSELTKKDKFIHPYVGKIYSHGDTEVISMGLEHMHRDPAGFAKKDPEHFELIFNVMHNTLP